MNHPKILLTAFQGSSAEQLIKAASGFDTLRLPNDKILDSQLLIDAIADGKYDFVFSFGQKPKIKNKVYIETTAKNGNDLLQTSFDCQKLQAIFAAKGIPAKLSHNAGTSYCNSLYDNGLAYLRRNELKTKMVFIHIPFLKNIDDKEQFFTKVIDSVRLYMTIGMKRGAVYLEEHRPEWEDIASQTIRDIKRILQNAAVDIQHIGSTSIRSIPAKPIIDLAVAIRDYEAVLQKAELLKREQIIFRFDERPVQLLFVKGDFVQDTRTHHIHVVLHNSKEWSDYITLRDYLNTHDAAAERYAELKIELSKKYPNDRVAYTEGKSDLIAELLAEAAAWKSKG